MNKIIKTEPDEPLREEDEDSSDSNPYDEDFDVSISQAPSQTLLTSSGYDFVSQWLDN